MVTHVVDLVLGLGLGVIFALSAVPKLRYPRTFILQVLEYRIVGVRASKAVGHLLPPVELIVGLLLIVGAVGRAVVAAAIVLLTMFIAGIGINLARGRYIECGCFGAGRTRTIGWPVLVQDLALLGACVELLRSSTSWTNLAPWSPLHAVASPSINLVVAGTCVAAGIVTGIAAHARTRSTRPIGGSSSSARRANPERLDAPLPGGQ